MVTTSPRLLIMGFRKGLIQALKRRKLDFALWSDKPVPTRYRPEYYLAEDFPRTTSELESKVLEWGTFSHVISCVESAVYPASLIRRPLQARLSKDSVILRCHDKLKMKQYLRKFDVPMAPFLRSEDPRSEEEILHLLGSPVVVKDRRLSGGRGMRQVSSASELKQIREPEQIFERYIKATESSIESFVHNGQILFQNITFYRTPGHTNLLPTHQTLEECAEILKLNEKILADLGIQWGMSHVEIYNAPTGPVFGEIALRPPGGHLMELISHSYGFNAWDAFLAVELGEDFEFRQSARQWSASLILHPGEGYLHDIQGEEIVAQLDSLKRFRLKDCKNKFIPSRKGVGEELGHIILSHTDANQLLNDVKLCESELKFEVSSPSEEPTLASE